MFDLNDQITKWHNGLAQSEAFNGRDIDELRCHLREEIEQLTAAGLSQQEAFLVARQRLGDTDSLESEFAKVNAGRILRNRLFWMVAGAFAYLLAKCLGGASGNAGALIGGLAGLGAYGAAVIGITAGALGYGVILLVVYSVCRRDSKILSFGRLAGDLRGKIVLLTSLVVGVAALAGATVLFSMLITRIMSPDEVGRIALVSSYVRLALSVLLPVVLMVLLIKLRVSNFRPVRR